MKYLIATFSLVLILFCPSQILAQSTNYAIRFNGNGVNDIDRIKIPLVNPETAANIGNTDFTIEWWMNAAASNNTATTSCSSNADSWINGHIMIDRDIYGGGDYGDYGISLMNGRIAFGVHNGSTGTTACGTTNIANGQWHHVAVTRNHSTGQLRIYVDGTLDNQTNGPTGNIHYRANRSTSYPNSDPFLVLGAEKHDAGSEYPSYNGLMDELRISNTIRYTSNFTRPSSAFVSDTNTRLLYHFNDGSGTTVTDSSTHGVNGSLKVGGNPQGPVYVASTAPISGTSPTSTPNPTPTTTPSPATPTPSPQPTVNPTPTLVPVPSNSPAVCAADINRDKVVDLTDYSILATNFLSTAPQNPRADINGDGVVDLTDYSILATNFLKQNSNCPTPTPIASSTKTPSPTSTPNPTSTPSPATPTPLPSPITTSNEWTQHAFNAQHTSYSPQQLPTPWSWNWSWNGPSSNGTAVSGKTSLPRNVQPVTGDGRVYVAAGSRGVFALDKTDKNGDRQADVLWNATQVGTVNSTVAYDPTTQSVFVLSTQGTLYKLSASTGATQASVSLGATSNLPLPPTIYGDRVYAGMGSNAFAFYTHNLGSVWTYATGSTIQTPLAYSPAHGKAVVGTADLYVHAINATNGSRAWRVKPSVVSAGSPNEFSYGWPVISEANGLVLMKMRLNWDTLFFWTPWPTTNAAIRNNLAASPSQQALFALNINTGNVPFIVNVGHGGYGDGGYMPMGPQPVVKKLADGTETAFTVIRGDNRYDGRWDSHFGEVVLNDNTVSGLSAGSVRWIQYGNYGWSNAGNNDTPPTDEQANVTMAGDQFFGGHWALGNAFTITDRSATYGLYTNPIKSSPLPHIVSSTNVVSYNNQTHYSSNGIAMTAGGTEWRAVPYGFYMYNDSVGKIYDSYWSGYAVWIPSGNDLYFRSNDGSIIALKSANSTASTINVPKTQSFLASLPGKVLGAMSSLSKFSLPLVSADSPVSYLDAGTYEGQTKTIEAKVEYIFNNGKTVLLGFHYPHQGYFKVQIPKEIWSEFGDSFGAHIGRNQESVIQEGDVVKVTGLIEFYQGDPTLYLEDISQLTVLSK